MTNLAEAMQNAGIISTKDRVRDVGDRFNNDEIPEIIAFRELSAIFRGNRYKASKAFMSMYTNWS